ncbi:hypothetical protein [Acidovorax sp.]|uniref:hypothetical protein n=1 Tax=Acidovorax sp. TaxID=1872122 RepID=UPI00391FC313
MSLTKRMWEEQIEEDYREEVTRWIREQLDDEDADENHPRWEELERQYRDGGGDYYDYADEWDVKGKTRLELFDESMTAVREMLSVKLSDQARRSLYVMLYAHVVASVEGYLSSTFIAKTLSSKTYIQALVESDPDFGGRSLTMKEIFSKQAGLHDEIGKYLKNLIFHQLDKVKPMYKSVFNIDFGNIGWLFKAVMTRHDCVHRAGYDKDGHEVSLDEAVVADLVGACVALVHKVDAEILALPKVELLIADF